MNVLLINPPRLNEISANNPEIIESERGYNPPLGLLYIASYLERNSKHQVSVLDCQVEELTYPDIERFIKQAKPDVIGITAMTFTLLDVIKVIETVKRIDNRILVVLGGPHVNIYPDESINIQGVDFLVLGEGEEIFTDLLNALESGKAISALTGIVFKERGGTVRNNRGRLFFQDLDKLPFPARQLTPYEKYGSLLARRLPVTTMITSRGCPYECTFCNRPAMGKVFRKRSPKNIVDEIEMCVNMGIHEFLIYDDNFTVDRKRILEICDEIINRKLDIAWHARAHVNTVTEDMLDAMKTAGCASIHYGIESGVNRILKIIKKNVDIEMARKVIKATKKRKIKILTYFMIGLPTETVKDIKETFKFAKALDPDYLHMTILTPFPATAIYSEGIREGAIKKDYWREFALSPTSDFDPPYWEEIFTGDELHRLLKEGYKSFYLRPGYALKRLLNLKSFGQFKRELRAGFKVLNMQG